MMQINYDIIYIEYIKRAITSNKTNSNDAIFSKHPTKFEFLDSRYLQDPPLVVYYQ